VLIDGEVRKIWLADQKPRAKPRSQIRGKDRDAARVIICNHNREAVLIDVELRRQNLYELKYGMSDSSS